MPLIPAFKRQRQVDLCEFEASLVYIATKQSGPIATQRTTGLKIKGDQVKI